MVRLVSRSFFLKLHSTHTRIRTVVCGTYTAKTKGMHNRRAYEILYLALPEKLHNFSFFSTSFVQAYNRAVFACLCVRKLRVTNMCLCKRYFKYDSIVCYERAHVCGCKSEKLNTNTTNTKETKKLLTCSNFWCSFHDFGSFCDNIFNSNCLFGFSFCYSIFLDACCASLFA